MTTRAIIFDNDGCLQSHNPERGYGDPEDHYYAGFEAIALTFGKHLEKKSELRQKVMGIDIRDVGRFMIEELDLPISYNQWKKSLDNILLALAPFAEIGPGGEYLLRELHNRSIRIGVASSAVKRVLERKWERYPELRQLLNCFVAGDDPRVKQSKPAPDLLLVAAAELDVKPSDCIYVGDSKSDIQAARAAEMSSIAVPSGGRPKSYYVSAGADIIVESLAEILSHI